jgi:calcineurin-like phosphoesterase
MNVLFIGDIMGEPGRRVLLKHLPKAIQDYHIDVVVGNGENAAGGFGITPDIAQELFDLGLSAITLGNHAWDKREAMEYLQKEPRGILQLMGRVFMPMVDCPFRVAERELAQLTTQADYILVDMHAETTSEKMAMGYFLDGKVSVVLGTHTHVQTADEQILPQGTGYLTDVGMTGPVKSVIGMKHNLVIQKFLTQLPRRFEVAPGPSVLCAAVVKLDRETRKTTHISRLRIFE